MARTWFAVALLVTVLLGCLAISYLVGKRTDTATELIEHAQLAAEGENYPEALRLCDEAISFWKEHDGVLSSFLRHEESSNVETSLRQLKSFAESESQESFLATCAQLLAQMEHIKEGELPLLHNIL